MPWISNPGSDRAVTCQRVNFRLEPDRVGASRRSVAEQRGDGRELSLRRPQRRLFYLEAAALLAGCPVNEAIPSPLTVARAELLYCALRRIPTTYHDVQTRSDRGVGRGQVSVRQALLLEPRPFCIREARRLGERKLKEWPELFTDDVLKFIAPRKDVCVSANFLYSVSYRRRGVQLRVSVLLEVRQIAERGRAVSGRSIASPAMPLPARAASSYVMPNGR